ncbi:MAG: hypothetical protein K9M84_07740 [Spirochaetia bacterium]|nr:hypothetical protein [Spirochaetia bacterium]
MFITIHQPCCVDALEPEDVWILEKAQEGFSTIRRASDYAIIRDMVEVDIDEEPKMVQDPSIMSGDRSKKSNRIDFLLYYFLDN